MTENPTDRPLDPTEIRAAVAEAILRETRNRGYVHPPQLVSPERVGRTLGLNDAEITKFIAHNNEGSFTRVANRFFNTLIALGILERAWQRSSDYDYYEVGEDGEEQLRNLTSMERAFTLQFTEALQDRVLRTRCSRELVLSGEPDTLIREACTVLEDRLKEKTNPPPKTYRSELAAIAFLQQPPKTRLRDDRDEQQAGGWLYKGILGYFGNQVHHELVDFPAKRARQIVGFIDTLLVMLEEATEQLP